MMRIFIFLILLFALLAGCEETIMDPTPGPVNPTDTIIIPPDTMVPPPDTIIDPPDTNIMPPDPLTLFKEQLDGIYAGNYIIKTRHVDPSGNGGYTIIDTSIISLELLVRHCEDTTRYTFNYGGLLNCCYDEAAFHTDSMYCNFQMGNIYSEAVVYPLSKNYRGYSRVFHPSPVPPDFKIYTERWFYLTKE